MPLLPGAEPVEYDGGPVGALVCHGFTSTPLSVRPWGQHLAEGGLTVACPRLPGHGTRWQELNLTRWPDWYAEVGRTFDRLLSRCESVFVLGLSMGGTLALRLAEERSGSVAGVVLVNASLGSTDRRMAALPLVSRVLPSMPGVGGDIRRPEVDEQAYDRVPLRALHSLTRLWALTRADLGRITAPVLAFRSTVDHVVEPLSGRLLMRGVAPGLVEERLLLDSYHVATLDNDAQQVFDGSLDFVRRVADARGASASARGPATADSVG